MKLTLKSYKSCRGADFDAFSATLYVDGKRAALVWSDGNGGEYRYDWHPSDKRAPCGPMRKKVEAWVKTQPDTNLDIIVDDVINEMQETKQVKRWCKTKTVVKIPGLAKGQYRTINSLPSPALRKHIASKYPGAEIVNDRFAKKAA